MKLLIACDMEGISGVATWNHVDPSHAEYQRFRRIMTQDVNAAIQGAAAGGADEIIVTDGHWNGDNILIEEIDPRAKLNTGSPSPLSMVQGIDQGVDAVILVGYHARIGSQAGILDHTWSSVRVANLWINGRLVGETGLNGSVAGHFGAPVLMISGDQTVAAEAKSFIPEVETVIVKKASSRHSAECLAPAVSQAMIRETAEKAVRRFLAGQGPAPLQQDLPVTIEIEFMYSDMADRACMLPGSKRVSGTKVAYTAPDMLAAYLAFRSLVTLAAR
jgi:D-amino peptidase